MNMNKSKRKMQNIKVIVRVRPFSQRERDSNAKCVVQCVSDKDILAKDKKFVFDGVFHPSSPQLDVYMFVVFPMISDVLAGYNCTVFVYGQTGSGKTFTMQGGESDSVENWRNDPETGCIPRAAVNIFDQLSMVDTNTEYTVRVSYLELYNEEVRDLLTDNNNPAPLSLFADPINKTSVCVQGLTEVTVCSRNDIHNLLEIGKKKRHIAPTLMNHTSSRSHTVFTIIVHTRTNTVSGETILKTGKLNLVDLAGSENIAKSGLKDIRNLELANINKSLLTLGRVIKTLAEKNLKYVPYRDSKLTRILQDSLGGTTKTCIIATVSPSSTSYEETMSTLEYASRARQVTNCPVINEKTTDALLLKEVNCELEKLRKDLDAARNETGVYLDPSNYNALLEEISTAKNQLINKNEFIHDLNFKIENLESFKVLKLQEFSDLNSSFEETKKRLAEEQFVSKVLEEREIKLRTVVSQMKDITETYSNNEEILHNKMENLYQISWENEELINEKAEKATNVLNQGIQECVSFQNNPLLRFQNMQSEDATHNTSEVQNLISRNTNCISAKDQITPLIDSFVVNTSENVEDLTNTLDTNLNACMECCDSRSKEAANLCRSFCTKMLETQHSAKTKMNPIHRKLDKLYDDLLETRTKQDAIYRLMSNYFQNERTEIDKQIETVQVLKEQIASIQNETLSVTTNEIKRFQEAEQLRSVHDDAVRSSIKNVFLDTAKISKGILEESETLSNKIVAVSAHIDEEMEKNETIIEQLHDENELMSKNLQHSFKEREAVTSKSNQLVEGVQHHTNFIKDILNEALSLLMTMATKPVQHKGDTPVRQNLNIEHQMETPTPRELLIKKFKDHFELLSDNKENSPDGED